MTSNTETDEWKHVECPNCGLQGQIPSWWEDFKGIECKKCDNQFTFEEGKETWTSA